MIKSDNYITDEIRKAAEKEAIANLMNVFTQAMFEKIMAKSKQGYHGWDGKDPTMIELLRTRLQENINRGDYVDVANIAMFLWNMQQPDPPSSRTQ